MSDPPTAATDRWRTDRYRSPAGWGRLGIEHHGRNVCRDAMATTIRHGAGSVPGADPEWVGLVLSDYFCFGM